MTYPNQAAAARKILKHFNERFNAVLLVALMQAGKTGVCLAVIRALMDLWDSLLLSYQIFYITNVGDNDLRGQVQKRIFEEEIPRARIQNLHLSDLRAGNFTIEKGVDQVLVIHDEAHCALGNNTLKGERPLLKIQEALGYRLARDPKTWLNKNVSVLCTTATPAPFDVRMKVEKNSFKRVTLEPGQGCYTPAQLVNDGRVRQSFPLIDDGKVSDFLKERIEEFARACQSGNAGHFVIRAYGTDVDIIRAYILKTYGSFLESTVFDSKKADHKQNRSMPIEAFDGYVASPRKKRGHVAIIRGGFRQGKTLLTTKYLRGWVEPPYSAGDTTAQSGFGRVLGYPALMPDGSKWSKAKDRFIIWTNLEEVENYLRAWEADDHSGMSGRMLKKIRSGQIHREPKTIELPKACATKKQIKAYVRKYLKLDYDPIIRSCSHRNENMDFCDEVGMRGVPRNIKAGEDKIDLFWFDAPQPCNPQSWERLKKAKPNYIGNVIYFVEGVAPTLSPEKANARFKDAHDFRDSKK